MAVKDLIKSEKHFHFRGPEYDAAWEIVFQIAVDRDTMKHMPKSAAHMNKLLRKALKDLKKVLFVPMSSLKPRSGL